MTAQQTVDRAELDFLLNSWATRIGTAAAEKLRAADPVTFDAVSDVVRELVDATTYAGASLALDALAAAPGVLDPDALLAYLRETQR